jgi:hypothetical protein
MVTKMATGGTKRTEISGIIYLVNVKHMVTKMATGGTKRTSGYFGDQTPNE